MLFLYLQNYLAPRYYGQCQSATTSTVVKVLLVPSGIYTTYNNNNNNNNKRGELVEQPVDFYEPYVLTATQPIVSNYPGKNGCKTVVAVVVVN